MKNIIVSIGSVACGFGIGLKIGKSIKNKNVCFVLGCTIIGLSVGLVGISSHDFNKTSAN